MNTFNKNFILILSLSAFLTLGAVSESWAAGAPEGCIGEKYEGCAGSGFSGYSCTSCESGYELYTHCWYQTCRKICTETQERVNGACVEKCPAGLSRRKSDGVCVGIKSEQYFAPDGSREEWWNYNCEGASCVKFFEQRFFYDEQGRYLGHAQYDCKDDVCTKARQTVNRYDENGKQIQDIYECSDGVCSQTMGFRENSHVYFLCSGGNLSCQTGDCSNEACKTIDSDDFCSAGCQSCTASHVCTKCKNENFKLNEGECDRVRYTPAEAAAIASDNNTNVVTITFKK